MLQYKYDKVSSVEEGVRRLLTVRDVPIPEFSIEPMGEGGLCDTLILGERRIPIFRWRHDPRMNAMRNYALKAPDENCALNTVSFIGKDTSLDAIIYRELDIAEYLLVSKTEKITAFVNGGACNLVAKMESEGVAGLELGATMAPGTIPQFNHRLITKHGMASDKTVNNIVEQSGVYLFADGDPRPVAYDDGEYYLYGLSVEESCAATFIQSIILGRIDADALIEQDRHLRELLALVHESARIGKSVKVKEGK